MFGSLALLHGGGTAYGGGGAGPGRQEERTFGWKAPSFHSPVLPFKKLYVLHQKRKKWGGEKERRGRGGGGGCLQGDGGSGGGSSSDASSPFPLPFLSLPMRRGDRIFKKGGRREKKGKSSGGTYTHSALPYTTCEALF